MATPSTHVIQYIADTTGIRKGVSEINRLNTQITKTLGREFANIQRIVGQSFERIKPLGEIEFGGKKGIGQLRELGTVVQTADGRFKELTRTVTIFRGKPVQSTITGLKDVTDQFRRTSVETEKASKSQVSFTENLTRLAKRAALTIPIWFALRNSIQAVFTTIRDGLGDIVEFDRSLQKLRRNLEATSSNVTRDFDRVKKEIIDFSLRSGQSVESVTNAIQKFATVGFGVEESLRGGIQATKLAVTLFGDAEETANAFARSLRVLTEDMKTSEERSKAISEAIALTDRLWQDNAFEVNEFSGNLEKFAGTARIANLSINETLALLATLSTGGLAGRAGRLLRSTFLRALTDVEGVVRDLELEFDPEKQSTVQLLFAIIDRLKELKTLEGVPADLASEIKKIFQIRGAEPIAALVALEGTLRRNLALIPDLKQFEDSFEGQTKQINRLVERFQNLNREIGKAFVTGLVGGEDFRDSLETIVEKLEEVQRAAEIFGRIVSRAFQIGIISAFSQVLLDDIQASLNASAEAAEETAQRIVESINKGLRRNLDIPALRDLIIELETLGATRLGFDENTFNKTLIILRDILQKEKDITGEKEKQTKQSKEQQKFDRDRRTNAEIILNRQLEILRTRGALNSEIIKAENITRRSLNIESKKEDFIKRQLELEQSINEERRLQNDLSSDAVKLFRIARDEGTEVAKSISEVLSGDRDFANFVRRGGRELEVFKKEFGDIFESQQAKRFFEGLTVPGLQGLRGGTSIELSLEDQAKVFGAQIGQALRQAQAEFDRAETRFQFIERMEAKQAQLETIRAKTLTVDNIDNPNVRDPFTSQLPTSRGANPFIGIQSGERREVIKQILSTPPEKTVNLRVVVGDEIRQISGLPERLLQQVRESVEFVANSTANEVVTKAFDNIENNPNSKESKKLKSGILGSPNTEF